MEEVNKTVQVPQLEIGHQLAVINCTDEAGGSTCGCSKNSTMSVSTPICFLVREQAKSLIAIQDLQMRMHHLEGVQGDVITAISEVHDYLSVVGEDVDDDVLQATVSSGSIHSKRSPSVQDNSRYLLIKKNSLSISPFRTKQASSKFTISDSLSPNTNRNESWQRSRSKSENNATCEVYTQETKQKIFDGIKSKDSALDSDKQDSGLDSDCRDQGQEGSIPQNSAVLPNKHSPSGNKDTESDELLELLDEIGHKSEVLRQHIDSVEEGNSPPTDLNLEMSKLHVERLGLQNLLCDIKGERDDLRAKLVNLENVSDELASENKGFEQRLMSTLVEKHKLETRMQGLQVSCSKMSCSSRSSSELTDTKPSENELRVSKVARRLVHKVDSATVSAILKETNVVDLQKQVLIYLMENEVLHTKLMQVEQFMASKESEKCYLEKIHKEEIRQLTSENERLRINLEEQRLETAALKSKVRMLERVLESVTLENRELNFQLGESLCLREALLQSARLPTQRLSSSASSSTSKRMSLPAQHWNEHDISVSCAKSKILPNTSSFIDVTIEGQDSGDEDYFQSGMHPVYDATHFRYQRAGLKASTPLISTRKQHTLKYSDLMKSPVPSSIRACSPCVSHHQNIKKPLNPNCENACTRDECLPSNADFEKTSNGISSSDRLVKRTNSCLNRTLESIKEKPPNDSSKFPFHSILAKLKSSDYKSTSRSISQEDSPATNCSQIAANTATQSRQTAQDSDQTQTKDKRTSSGHSKNIHKRIQDILDRITAEQEEAVV